jgi:hypothetical protein
MANLIKYNNKTKQIQTNKNINYFKTNTSKDKLSLQLLL